MLTTIAAVMLLAVEATEAPPAQDEQPVAAEAVHVTSRGARIGGSMVGVLIGGTATVAVSAVGFMGAWLIADEGVHHEHTSKVDDIALATAIAIYGAGALFVLPVGAWLGSRIAGGEGTYLGTVLGAAVGTTIGAGLLVAAYFDTPSGGGSDGGATMLGLMGVTAILLGPVVGAEVSHHLNTLPKIGVAPTKGGGTVALAWEI